MSLKALHTFIESLKQPYESGISSFLQMLKLRLRKGSHLTEDGAVHRAPGPTLLLFPLALPKEGGCPQSLPPPKPGAGT